MIFISSLQIVTQYLFTYVHAHSTATEFITCEQEKIANQEGYFKVLEKDKLLTGYQIGVIKEWALQPWRFSMCSSYIS